jgi:hypothetical protein
MPAYKVSGKSPALGTLVGQIVIANTASQAMSFVADSLLECETLGAQEVAELVAGGMPVVDSRTKPVPSPPPAAEPPKLSSGVAAVSSTLWVRPNGEVGEMYMHKAGCQADPWTPIGSKGCKCTSLDMPATGEGIAS